MGQSTQFIHLQMVYNFLLVNYSTVRAHPPFGRVMYNFTSASHRIANSK